MKSYQELTREDLIEVLAPAFDAGMLKMTPEHKIVMHDPVIELKNPWIFGKMTDWQNCALWHQIFFSKLGMLPYPCFECWKVVVRPQTVVDLMKFHEWQMTLDRPGKSGIELRPTVCGLYGGYFYNHSLDAGKECYDFVTKEMPIIAPVILKRGCTEFEHTFGPSNEWVVDVAVCELQDQLSGLLRDTFVNAPQNEMIRSHIKRHWIHWAYQSGDLTYLKLTGGKTLYPKYVTYQK